MAVDIARWQILGSDAVTDSRRRRRRKRAGTERDQVPVLEFLESRRLLSAGGSSQGVATGAGPDANIWFTMGSNHIGMINPNNPVAGVTQYAIPTAGSGPGPIAAGPQAILYASDIDKGQIYKVDKTTGALLQTIPVSAGSTVSSSTTTTTSSTPPGRSAASVRFGGLTPRSASRPIPCWPRSETGDMTSPWCRATTTCWSPAQTTGKIYEVNLNDPGQTPTTFGSGQYTDGIVYDSSGRLFAVSSNSKIVELDPNTFNVIASSGPLSGLDGLAFDSYHRRPVRQFTQRSTRYRAGRVSTS